MRPTTEVLPRPLAIDRDRFILRQVGDDLGFIVLANAPEVRDGLVAAPNLTINLLVAVDDLAHFGFDLWQIIQREGLVACEVIIEAVLDRGPDGHLRSRK